jgi:transcriptional regulator with XRE-family HTH domain
MNINQRVKYAILISGKNQYELADLLGVSQPAVNKYVNGTSKPGEEGLKKLASISGIDYEWIKLGSGKVPLGFKDFIVSAGLTREQLIEKVNQLENEVEKRDSKISTLKKELQAKTREIELLERLTEKGNIVKDISRAT